MQYNESLYNGDSYNLTNYAQTLVETIAPTDAAPVFSVEILRTDSQGTADALGGSASLQAFLETITIYQRANTPFAYNNGMYNQFMYNARADEDEVLLMATKALIDSITSTDAIGPFDVLQLLSETLTPSDTLTNLAMLSFFELIFLDSNLAIQITNKALSDNLRLADWLSIERLPAVDGWGD